MTMKELAKEIEMIKNNHLAHMEKNIDRIEKKVEKMDHRVWAILILLVSAVVVPAIITLIQSNA